VLVVLLFSLTPISSQAPSSAAAAAAIAMGLGTASSMTVQRAAPAPAMMAHVWHYVDASNKVQGPFTSQQIKGWRAQGYLNPTVKVKRAGDVHYRELGRVPELT
jgi:hypothetical protein